MLYHVDSMSLYQPISDMGPQLPPGGPPQQPPPPPSLPPSSPPSPASPPGPWFGAPGDLFDDVDVDAAVNLAPMRSSTQHLSQVGAASSSSSSGLHGKSQSAGPHVAPFTVQATRQSGLHLPPSVVSYPAAHDSVGTQYAASPHVEVSPAGGTAELANPLTVSSKEGKPSDIEAAERVAGTPLTDDAVGEGEGEWQDEGGAEAKDTGQEEEAATAAREQDQAMLGDGKVHEGEHKKNRAMQGGGEVREKEGEKGRAMQGDGEAQREADDGPTMQGDGEDQKEGENDRAMPGDGEVERERGRRVKPCT